MCLSVGTQGQERRVIIISCVRSSPEHLKMDEMYKLGFLRNPKRYVH
jgi:superfamily I DNA and/or RNA helicase